MMGFPPPPPPGASDQEWDRWFVACTLPYLVLGCFLACVIGAGAIARVWVKLS